MKDSANFTNRLQKLLDYYDLSASSFATKIGVQRSSISHILSGRNKPSLDFVMKVLHCFSEVSIEWLIDGNGIFPKTENTPTPIHKSPIETLSNQINQQKQPTEIEPKKEMVKELTPKLNSDKKIKKVIVLYTDGSFEAFQN